MHSVHLILACSEIQLSFEFLTARRFIIAPRLKILTELALFSKLKIHSREQSIDGYARVNYLKVANLPAIEILIACSPLLFVHCVTQLLN